MAERFRTAADHYEVLARSPQDAIAQIAALDLDVLMFADVGMDALTSTLAFSRMAPVQCVTWGHPETTGSPHMDYFLSSELLEVPEADAHYTEQLVRLPVLGTYYERPAKPKQQARADFHLTEEQHVYLCPQTLFKFHPDFDEVLAAILKADPDAVVVLIAGRVAEWTQRLQRRFGEDPCRTRAAGELHTACPS